MITDSVQKAIQTHEKQLNGSCSECLSVHRHLSNWQEKESVTPHHKQLLEQIFMRCGRNWFRPDKVFW